VKLKLGYYFVPVSSWPQSLKKIWFTSPGQDISPLPSHVTHLIVNDGNMIHNNINNLPADLIYLKLVGKSSNPLKILPKNFT